MKDEDVAAADDDDDEDTVEVEDEDEGEDEVDVEVVVVPAADFNSLAIIFLISRNIMDFPSDSIRGLSCFNVIPNTADTVDCRSAGNVGSKNEDDDRVSLAMLFPP